MANGKSEARSPSLAFHDFYKTNGTTHVFVTEGPSLTRQEFAEECDINSLMSRYEGHVVGGPGNLGHMVEPAYIDFAEMPTTLLEYMEFMDKAQSGFMTLPARVRREFDNNAHFFVEYASDPANIDQMRAWGLAPAKVDPQPPQAVPGSSAPLAGGPGTPGGVAAAPAAAPPGGPPRG